MVLARALAPGMVERGEGQIVFISSLSGKAASPRSSIYSATKFGLRGFALAPPRPTSHRTGVGVSIVSPGFVRDAGMFAESGARSPARALALRRRSRSRQAVVRAIERDTRVEVARSPRSASGVLAHSALGARGLAVRGRRGGAPKIARRGRRGHRAESAGGHGGQRSRGSAATASAPATRSRCRAREYEIFRLDALQASLRRRPPSLLAQGPARERASTRGRRVGHRARTSRRSRAGTRRAEPELGDPVPAGAGADAGLHRRARARRPGGDARRDGGAGRRSARRSTPWSPST